MAELPDAAIDAALTRGSKARASEPRAASARYDHASGRVIVDLENGCTFAFPPRLAEGLDAASDDQLAAVEILGQGYGLHWEELDVDLSLPDLMGGYSAPERSWPAAPARRPRRPRLPLPERMGPRAGGRAKQRIANRRSHSHLL